MDIEIIKFKLLKLSGIYKKQGAGGAFTFLINKIKKRIHQQFFYSSFHKELQLTEADIDKAKAEIEKMTYKPVFSIIMPVYNVDEPWLVKAIESVIQQIYPHWELCIANDASAKPHIKPLLDKYASLDKRIKVVHRAQSGNISAASNSAIELATGEYIGLLDHDDELTKDALFENARVINKDPNAGIIYSDEDKIDEGGKHFNVWCKPDWSPEYLLTHMYVCHFGVYKTDLVKAVGGFRSGFDGAQDYDLCLRVSEKTKAIYHIPKILYHWRTLASSTASNPMAKTYAYEAGRKAVEEHLQRTQGGGTVSFTEFYGVYKVNHKLTSMPLVSIIIPSAGKQAMVRDTNTCLLENCISSIRQKSTYKHIEIVVVDGNDISTETLAFCEQAGAKIIHCNDPFNFSQRINLGVKASSGEYVLMLNDDTEIITPTWIEELLGFAQQQDIGAVGAKLLTAQHQVQHAGIILIENSPGHIYYGVPDIGQGYFNALVAYKNYLAVTGACLMVSRKKYDEVGLMDETFPVNYNDVDLCLKLHEKGYRNVFNPHVVLYHYESISRAKGYQVGELHKFILRWQHYPPALSDPYYSPVLVKYPAMLQ